MPRHFSSLHVIAPNAISEQIGSSYMQLESDIDICQFYGIPAQIQTIQAGTLTTRCSM